MITLLFHGSTDVDGFKGMLMDLDRFRIITLTFPWLRFEIMNYYLERYS